MHPLMGGKGVDWMTLDVMEVHWDVLHEHLGVNQVKVTGQCNIEDMLASCRASTSRCHPSILGVWQPIQAKVQKQ